MMLLSAISNQYAKENNAMYVLWLIKEDPKANY
jgi:hypothetical protein